MVSNKVKGYVDNLEDTKCHCGRKAYLSGKDLFCPSCEEFYNDCECKPKRGK